MKTFITNSENGKYRDNLSPFQWKLQALENRRKSTWMSTWRNMFKASFCSLLCPQILCLLYYLCTHVSLLKMFCIAFTLNLLFHYNLISPGDFSLFCKTCVTSRMCVALVFLHWLIENIFFANLLSLHMWTANKSFTKKWGKSVLCHI